ncbi:TPA: hypothetical protein HA231_00065 [Candidatus Woesearchaeota archaeon]|nr:hypothetical protein [Candidatus Woesearchaeota archaeon]
MPSKLFIPGAAVAAARSFGESKLGISGSNEADLEGRIMQLHENVSYGIAQTIASGCRLRLFDQFNPSQIQLNCGEAGIAAFTIYKAFSQRKDLQVLRYQPTAETSHHFGLVRSDGNEGFVIIDPLMGLYGKIRLAETGFAFYPFEWLKAHDMGTVGVMPSLAMDGVDRNAPLKVISDLSFLDEDTLVRHVNFMNSPLGFFAYFADGQRLEDKPTGNGNVLFSAELEEDGLTLRGTGLAEDPVFLYTLERHFDWDGSHKGDREKLHTRIDWVRPENSFYSCVSGKEEIPYEVDAYMQSFALHFLTTDADRGMFMFSPHQRGWLLRRMRQTLEKWHEHPPEIAEAVFALSDMGIINVELDAAALVTALEEQCDYLTGGKANDRQEGLDFRLNRAHFFRRAQGMPNQWPEQKVLERMRTKADKPRQQFAADIKAYFESPVVTALIGQYREAINFVALNSHMFGQQAPVQA